MQKYTEKEMLSDALTAEKTATGLYNQFANECSHKDLRDEMMNLLNEEHGIQQDVFNYMHSKGYYPTPAAETTKIDAARQTFAETVK